MCGPAEARVAMTIHVSGETLEILGDTALAREISNVAKASHGQKVKRENRNQSIAAVIEELIEDHRDELEAESKGIRPGQARREALAHGFTEIDGHWNGDYIAMLKPMTEI